MSFFTELQKNINDINNLQRTENGAIGYKSTGKTILDMNFNVPKYRNATPETIIEKFNQARSENPELAILWTFFARDVRGGLGERRLFRILFREICNSDTETAKKVIPLVSEYGRWDDLIYSTINTPAWEKTIEVVKAQLLEDTENVKANKPITLLGKWLPSERTSSVQTRETARKIAHDIGLPIKDYNRMLVALRKYSNVVEVKMSAREWGAIDYSAVPSYANLKYNSAFLRNDEERRRKYLAALTKGETKINASTAFPHDIVKKYKMGWHYANYADEAIEAMWKALPDMGGLDNTIVVADGSGSMYRNENPDPIDVANALAIYCAEHGKGEFYNKYITFSHTPKFVDLSNGKTLLDKLNIASHYNEAANTNIEATFDIILDTAIESKAAQEDIPKSILIISDMEFDNCVGTYNGNVVKDIWGYNSRKRYVKADSALFNVIKKRYEKAGYKMPRIIFWNVASRTGTIPIKENDLGVTLVSGYSVSIFKMIMDGETDPFQNLVNTLMSERYQPIYKAIQ